MLVILIQFFYVLLFFLSVLIKAMVFIKVCHTNHADY